MSSEGPSKNEANSLAFTIFVDLRRDGRKAFNAVRDIYLWVDYKDGPELADPFAG